MKLTLDDMSHVEELSISGRKTDCLVASFKSALADNTVCIGITEWWNGEGFDLSIDEKQIAISWDELNVINYMLQNLHNSENFT